MVSEGNLLQVPTNPRQRALPPISGFAPLISFASDSAYKHLRGVRGLIGLGTAPFEKGRRNLRRDIHSGRTVRSSRTDVLVLQVNGGKDTVGPETLKPLLTSHADPVLVHHATGDVRAFDYRPTPFGPHETPRIDTVYVLGRSQEITACCACLGC
jgi:hypothetical protein